MGAVIIPIILGIYILKLGFSNRNGNISSVHWYHRTRITEKNRVAFGRMIGLGTIIMGVSMIAFGCFAFLSEILQ